MSDDRFLRLYAGIEKRRKWIVGILVAVVVLAGLSLLRVRYDNTLDLMLPADSPAQRMMAFLRDANFSNKIVISLEARDGKKGKADLLAASDALARSLVSPLVTKVVTGYTTPDLIGDTGFLVRNAPQLLGPGDLADIEALLTPAGVSGVVQRLYCQLLKPEGMFTAQAIRSDPLSLRATILDRLGKLSASMGYEVTMEDGHFVSRDGRHTLLLVETTVPLTDATGARVLMRTFEEALSRLPAGITASLVCGHTHVVSNEDTIKRDLGVVLSLASILFIVIYILFFRDPRALVIFLIPALAAVIALAVTALFFPRLSYFVMAFGPVIAGIADDYGIAVYVAIRHGADRARAVRSIVSPVMAGALTTTGIFFAFFFSRVPGYYQLAWFCIISIFLTVVLALGVLPLFLRPGKTPEEIDATPSFRVPRHARVLLAGYAVVFLLAALLAGRVKFDNDITRLDGAAPSIVKAEEEFRAVWGSGQRKEAILAVVGNSPEAVREQTDEIYEKAVHAIGASNITSLSSVWPSARTRAMRGQAWLEFWRDGREARLRSLLAEQGAARGFTTNAFDDFFSTLYAGTALAGEPASNAVLANLKDRFIQSPNGHCQTVSFFPDTPEMVASFDRILAGRKDALIVSRNSLGAILSEAFVGEVVRTSCLAGVMIVVTAWLFLRQARLTVVALAPAMAAVLGLLAFLGVTGRPLNVVNLISGIVVFGLSIDFGMHTLHACRHPQGAHARVAVTFAAITTIMGASVLLLARHPALFSVGLTLTVGVGLGYLAAMWMVPALYEVIGRRR